jgi:hypothetical protein
MAETSTQQLFDMWRRQMDEGAQAWLRLVGQSPAAAAPAALDPTAFWKLFMEQSMAVWERLMSQGPASPELIGQSKQFVDQWIATWGRTLEQAMNTEAFAQVLGKQLEIFLNAASPTKKAAEQYIEATLSGLGLPSRTQVVSLARQVVQLEEKIEGLEDRLDAVLKRLDEVADVLKKKRP